jgi:hypothetical protein
MLFVGMISKSAPPSEITGLTFGTEMNFILFFSFYSNSDGCQRFFVSKFEDRSLKMAERFERTRLETDLCVCFLATTLSLTLLFVCVVVTIIREL